MSTLFEKKHSKIVEAAIEIFISHGFGGTSVDKVAEKAGMSKVTVYNHFKDKKDLFEKVMEVHCAKLFQNYKPVPYALNKSLESNLTLFSENIIEGLLNPKSVALMRVVIFETGQFPELGKLIWLDGRLPMLDDFCRYLEFENQNKKTKIPNVPLAARQFFGMLKENLVWPTLMGLEVKTDAQFRKDVIESSVGMFIGHYGEKT